MCVIVYARLNNKQLLAKNRDRYYISKIEIIHEIINGTEIVYIKDNQSDCIDGMNEYGISIINSELNIRKYNNFDVSRYYKKKETKFLKKNGPYIKLKILEKNNIKDSLDTLLKNKYFEDLCTQGHIILASPNQSFHIETTTQDTPIVEQINNNNIVLTNHGITYPNAGKYNIDAFTSSVTRKRIIEKRLKKINDPNQLLLEMRKNCPNISHFMCPYKDRIQLIAENKYKDIENTTNQVMYNLTDKIMYFNYDLNGSVFLGIKNKLPKNYKPKIKIVINKIGTIRKNNTNNTNLSAFLFAIIIIILLIVIFLSIKKRIRL